MGSSSARNESTGPPAPRSAPVVHSITGAVQPHSDDMDARIKRYLFSMALRTLCVVLVLVIDSPIRWVFAVLAVILPYIAVVMANAAGSRRRPGAAPVPIARVPIVAGPVDLPMTIHPPEQTGRVGTSAERTN